MRYPYLFIFVAFLLYVSLSYYSCSNNDEDAGPEPVQLLRNPDMEFGISGDSEISGPQYWFDFIDPTDGDLDMAWSDEIYSSPTRSVMISSSIAHDSTAGVWGQFVNTGIIPNVDITLTVKIKAESLEGSGVVIAIRADNRSQQEVLKFATTEGIIDITGTFDWKEYSLIMESVPELTNGIFVFFIYLNNTTGTVYFDDAELTYDNP